MRKVSHDNGSFCCMHKLFQNRLHAIHCTNEFWAGQGQGHFDWFMRSRKTSSGLTHKTQIKENKRTLWTMSAHTMFKSNIAMQHFNELTYTTSSNTKIQYHNNWMRHFGHFENIFKAAIMITFSRWTLFEKHTKWYSDKRRCQCAWVRVGRKEHNAQNA